MTEENTKPEGTEEESDEEKEDKLNKIIYIGDDETYFENFKKELTKRWHTLPTKFLRLSSADANKIQSFIFDFYKAKPTLVLCDFTSNDKNILHLFRIWKRQNYYKRATFVGLTGTDQDMAANYNAVLSGMDCVHIKTSDMDAMMYDIGVLAFYEHAFDHKFATAQPENDVIPAFYLCRANFVTTNFVGVESNIPLIPKQPVQLHSYWSNKKVIRSPLAVMASQSNENLYYNFRYSQLFQLAHVDLVQKTDDMTPQDMQNKLQERANLVVDSQKSMNKWLKGSAYDSAPKHIKTYVVDKSLAFYKEEKSSDSYPFVIRCVPYVTNLKYDLTTIKPSVIVYHLDDEVRGKTAQKNQNLNDTRMLQSIVKGARQLMKGEEPYIVVFNSKKHDTEYLQKVLNYGSIIAVKEKLNPIVAGKMIESIMPKLAERFKAPKTQGGGIEVYVDKNVPESIAELETDVELVGISENDIYFQLEERVPYGTTFRMNLPVPMFVTVVEPPKHVKLQSKYYGIIHGIGEDDRKQLRQFVNSIFFRGVDFAKAKDKEEVEAMKKKFVEDKNREMLEAKQKREEQIAAQKEKARLEQEQIEKFKAEAAAKAKG